MFAGLTGWHIIILFFSIAPFVLWLVAIIQIATSRATGGTVALWIILATLIPLVGAILWFAIGLPAARREAAQRQPQPAPYGYPAQEYQTYPYQQPPAGGEPPHR